MARRTGAIDGTANSALLASGISADRSGSSMRSRRNLSLSSSRSVAGSVMAVPRSSAAVSAARAGKAQHSKANTMARNPSTRLMSQLTPRKDVYSRKKGASHRREAPSCSCIVPSARDDQSLAGHDHPAAVLLANGVDAAETGDGIAGIDL